MYASYAYAHMNTYKQYYTVLYYTIHQIYCILYTSYIYIPRCPPRYTS